MESLSLSHVHAALARLSLGASREPEKRRQETLTKKPNSCSPRSSSRRLRWRALRCAGLTVAR